ncbi:MAG: CFI-box-CTERM domain-containing protein [Smithella sp.]|jgi:hypothetical protein
MLHLTTKRTVAAVVFFLILTFILAGSASAYNITKIGDKGLYPQPDGDRHNSYSWCMGILHHSDGDYLYVGSNRDIAYLVMAGLFRTIKSTTDFATIKGYIENFFGGDIGTYATAADVDLHPRIFRLKLNTTDATWELIYTAPNVSGQIPLELGYRGMQVFTDTAGETALYVVTEAGSTKISRVLKISADSDPQDIVPKEVFRVTGTTSLRPIAVHNSKLYIGANNDIYEASNPEGISDWTKIAADSDFGGLIALGKKAMLWQFASFNGYLYVTLAEDVDPAQPQTADNGGAWLFKGKFDSDSSQWIWTPIIADQSLFPTAPYPKGLGNRFNSTLSLASFKDNLYVGTLMSFPSLIGTGNVQMVLQNRIPPQIYRFSKTDVGAMVIGDTVGPTKSTIFTSRIGNYWAGFFQPNIFQTLSLDATIRDTNFSLNQYLWWMAEYNGKLYASTFDLRVFLKYLTRTNVEEIGLIAPGDDSAWQTIQTMLDGVDFYNDNPAGFDIYYTSDGTNWTPLTRDGFGDQFNYGGRILLPSTIAAHPLYVGTANPFYGAQVYTVEDTSSSSAASSDSGSSGCFIATAAFGSSLDPHVNILRIFRDRFLLANAPGRAFVRFYYSHSPAAARFLERHEFLKPFVRLSLLPIIGICYLFINGFGALMVILFTLIPITALIIFRNRRRSLSVPQEGLQH